MKSKLLVVLLAAILLSSYAAQNTLASDIQINVKPNFKANLTLDLDFKYKTDANGILRLRYENSTWGDNDLFDCIDTLEVTPKPISIDFIRDSSLIVIKTTPNQEISIQYSIKQDFNEILTVRYRYRPIIEHNYFHILGMRLFILPFDLFEDDTTKAAIQINWADMPDSGLFHSSFGYNKTQLISVTMEELYASFFVGGDFRRYSFEYKNKPVYFVTRGDWVGFNDENVFELLQKVISFQHDFWSDTIQTQYSVSLIPTYESWTKTSKSHSTGGSGLTNSFISSSSNNAGNSLDKLTWLYNHELLHKWIGRVIANEEEVKQYWFSEGFTDYYSYKLMLKSGEISSKEFIEVINNKVLIPHYKSSVNSIPNSEITFGKFWSDQNYQKLPYRRGLLYAFLIDCQIKNKSSFTKSLDNLMLEILELAKTNDEFVINSEVFKSLLKPHLGAEALESFDKYITEGQLIDFKGELLDGVRIENTDGIPQLLIDPSSNQKSIEKILKL